MLKEPSRDWVVVLARQEAIPGLLKNLQIPSLVLAGIPVLEFLNNLWGLGTE